MLYIIHSQLSLGCKWGITSASKGPQLSLPIISLGFLLLELCDLTTLFMVIMSGTIWSYTFAITLYLEHELLQSRVV